MLGVSTRYVTPELVPSQGLPTARKLGRELRFERDAVVDWMRTLRAFCAARSARC